jgi:AraC-like DNA-binding protein
MQDVERVVMPGRYRLFDHRHDSGHMLVVLSGEVIEDGVSYRAGDVRFSSATDRHFLTFARETTCLVIAGDVPQPSCGPRRVARLGDGFTNRFVRSGRSKLNDEVDDLMRSALVQDAAACEIPAWLAEFELERQAGRMMNARGIDAAARMAGVSREHLARSYRRHFGTSVTGAIKARRLHAAWDSVTESTMALADVAGLAGFSDQSHMTRQFAEWIGLTPAAVRRAAQEVTRLQDGTLALAL